MAARGGHGGSGKGPAGGSGVHESEVGPATESRHGAFDPEPSPVKGGRARTAPGGKRSKRSKTATALRRSKQKLNAVKRFKKAGTKGGFAGYEAPDQAVDESAIGEARSIMRDPSALAKLLGDSDTAAAARAVGIPMEDLMPKEPEYFRTEPNRAEVLPKEKQQRRFDHFENRRLWKLAIVMTAANKGQEAKKARAKRQHQLGDELYDVFNSTLHAEEHRNTRIAGARNKVENVLLKENELLIQRRKEFEEREQQAKEREARIVRQRERRKAKLQERAVKRAEQVAQLQETRRVRAAAKVINATNAFEARDARVKDYLDAKMGAAGKMRREKDRMNRKREAIREEARAREEAARIELQGKLDEKARRALAVKEQRETEMIQKSEEKKLQAQSRMDNAARVRRVREEGRSSGADKMKAAQLRMSLQKELRGAIEDERRSKKKEQIIAIDKWKQEIALERNVTPGPGEYHNDGGKGPSGGTWGKYNAKTELDWQIYRAKQIPGPGEYNLPTTLQPAGGTWGKYAAKSDVEWQIYRASKIPGPGQYQPKELSGGAAVKFGDHDPPSQLELTIRRARDSPGPGAYSGVIVPNDKRKVKDIQKALKILASSMSRDDSDMPDMLPDPSPVRPKTRG